MRHSRRAPSLKSAIRPCRILRLAAGSHPNGAMRTRSSLSRPQGPSVRSSRLENPSNDGDRIEWWESCGSGNLPNTVPSLTRTDPPARTGSAANRPTSPADRAGAVTPNGSKPLALLRASGFRRLFAFRDLPPPGRHEVGYVRQVSLAGFSVFSLQSPSRRRLFEDRPARFPPTAPPGPLRPPAGSPSLPRGALKVRRSQNRETAFQAAVPDLARPSRP